MNRTRNFRIFSNRYKLWWTSTQLIKAILKSNQSVVLIFFVFKKECCGGVWIRTSLVLMYGEIVNVEYYHVVTKKALSFLKEKRILTNFEMVEIVAFY